MLELDAVSSFAGDAPDSVRDAPASCLAVQVLGKDARDMNSLRRSSRADRRKQRDSWQVHERRKGAPSEVSIWTQLEEEELLIFVQCSLTASNCAQAREVLTKHFQRAPAAVMVLDLEKCGYLETPGLGLLFELKRGLELQGKRLILQNPSRVVLRMLNITQTARIFPFRMTNTDHERIPVSRAAEVSPSSSADNGNAEI